MYSSAETASTIPGLSRNWDFQPSTVMRWQRRRAVELFIRNAHRKPAYREIKAVTPKPVWVIYFMYAPDGLLSRTHTFTLSRLRDLGLAVCVICATSSAAQMPDGLAAFCDALFWKDLPGYDFSAYTLGLQQISRHSPDANVLVLNDSVFGPFSDFRPAIEKSAWDLTGFSASNQLTSHIQSYCFSLRNVNRFKMAALASVFFPFASISNPEAVIFLQETRLARVASRSMKVGAFWYGDMKDVIDPTLARPMELLNAGFPFLKRSLLGKHKAFIDPDLMLSKLQQLGHPVDLR